MGAQNTRSIPVTTGIEDQGLQHDSAHSSMDVEFSLKKRLPLKEL